MPALRRAVLGPTADGWSPPTWLLPHQVDAARRIAASLRTFGGALLADAVGLGKTYTSLAISTLYSRTAVVPPASLVDQWRRVAALVGIHVVVVSQESLSRGGNLPTVDLVIVDEAHRLRNPTTRRYDRLARGVARAHTLLVTATPVVNRAADLVHLLRLFLSDHDLAALGVRSLQQALDATAYADMTHAASPLIVARSARTIAPLLGRLPRAADGQTVRLAPLPNRDLEHLLSELDKLEFPSFSDAHAVQLLRLHLLHRLASSPAACRETLRRHLAYLDRALAAARRGERLTRGAARHLLGPGDDLQLEFDSLKICQRVSGLRPQTLEAEQQRILQLLERLPNGRHPNPKATHLRQVLHDRRGCKTIVFTTAVATALDLARRLGWREVAAVGSGRAWIASGRIPVETALSFFAPMARSVAAPPQAARVSTLVATDLVSEGLNLQDADAIVHYDLPWTPLRLAQRLGRIARLGSRHDTAHVWWFAPAPPLERRLRLAERLHTKVYSQLQLGVTTTSSVGRAQVWNQLLECRERIGMAAGWRRVPSTVTAGPRFAVVRGPPAAALAVWWHTGTGVIPELLVVGGAPPKPMFDYSVSHAVLERLSSAPPSVGPPPHSLVSCALRCLRERMQAANAGPFDSETRRLARSVMRHARAAGQHRDVRRVVQLDAVLDRLSVGLRVGEERELADLLGGTADTDALRAWLRSRPSAGNEAVAFEVEAMLFGDGTAADGAA
ncbi:MAG: hypothetical protein GTN78_08195 [Gemmatimonadales bacterium]|nr:hypothetical protein [Gemmatimonadales bacterium]NIN12881.1 hypothetical protein [Gemmatimonadales bacterium]NIR00168.1 hypothetical protein [Gemmatimonadales bacterium]NIS65961.1 hypothetical protein [Gemmatimonadales bacterium]